jgi:hypothetical protein
MFRKLWMTSALGGLLAVGAANAAEVIVKIAPPTPIVEHRVAAPGPGFVWVAGYHRWDGNAYVWVPGEWRNPPHPHAHWVAHKWVHRHGGYVLVEGHWK